MLKNVTIVLACMNLLLAGGMENSNKVLFRDEFDGDKIKSGWHWLRKSPGGWSLAKGTLKIRTNGSLWESENTQQNILLRQLPTESATGISVEITVNSRLQLDQRYEHGGLIWYLDDDNWVTLTQLNHVQDKTQKIMLVHEREGSGRASESSAEPFNEKQVDLRLTIKNNVFTGHYRKDSSDEWHRLGSITFPKSDKSPKIGIIAGDGGDTAEHWVTFDNFIVHIADRKK